MILPAKRVAVIGAGISGVSATAHLKASGLEVTPFEQTGTPGGVWVFDLRTAPESAYLSTLPSVAETAYHESTVNLANIQGNCHDIQQYEQAQILHVPPGPCYKSLKNNVPTALIKVTLNSWPPGTEPIVKHNVLAEYIQDTASNARVDKVAQFHTKVERLSEEGNIWKVQTSTLEPKQVEKHIKNWEFDAVVVASGHYHAPKVPAILGLKDWKKSWASNIEHSKLYRNPRGYEGKNVLLIGGSTSSFDIAKDLVGIAKTIYHSTRGGEFDLPISMLPPELKRIPEVASFQLESQPGNSSADRVIPGTVTLVGGQVFTDIDRIIIATGYHCTFPFLPEHHQDSVPPSEADAKVLLTK